MLHIENENGMFRLSGIMDAGGALELCGIIPEQGVCYLDFSEVESISFAAQRKLLQAIRAGKKFRILNASDSVCERLEDTGVATLIPVSRKPKPIDMSKYEQFGEGFVAKSYYSADGDSVLKYYSEVITEEFVCQEKNLSRAVALFGLPTPMAGTIYRDDKGRLAMDFERIQGKKSLSRIISDDPSRMEEITVKFAGMCKQLHSTQCDTNIFSSRTDYYRNIITGSPRLGSEAKSRALAFIDSIPAVTTCIHGDMHPGNVIETPDGEDLWIDLGDFGYGYPMMDMGMWYFLSQCNTDERCQYVFHLSKEQMACVWDIFFKEYFAPKTREEADAILKEIEQYAALHAIYLWIQFGSDPVLESLITRVFGNIL